MKVSTVLVFSAAAIVAINAESYSEADKAIWIDRHNFFRTTGLPWSAGNMRRIGWDADLATKAASTAAKCSATTGKGVNAFQSSSSSASSAIDEAIQQWAVETAVSTIKTMAQPGSSGLDVGIGVYNSYSQIVWAKTTSVGCATATCSGGELVVCEYSPAGNDGKSAWYKHAHQASKCPDGTIASGGLCIDEDDDSNDQIAPIPAGDYTYQVYPTFVPDLHSVLLNSARDIAFGSIVPTTQASSSTKTSASASSSESSSSESLTKQESAKKSTPTNSSSESSSSASPATQEDDGDQAPGTVKASSETGSIFQNEAKTPLTHGANTAEGITELKESLTTSEGEEAGLASHAMSTTGMVGMFILGIGAVAGILVFVHYSASAEHQHDGGAPR